MVANFLLEHDEIDKREHEAMEGVNFNTDQATAFKMFLTGQSFFLTGAAGCGKSFLIEQIKQHCIRANKNCAVTALTGAAASLIGGSTLHSWAGVGLGTGTVDELVKSIEQFRKYRQNWIYTDILIIDEISMLSSELLTKLETIGRRVRKNEKFFGGMQVVFSGDFAQLEPIGQTTELLFENKLWKRHIEDKGHVIVLRKVVRQNDPTFQKILNDIRLGIVDEDTKRTLNSRIIKEPLENYAIFIEGYAETIKPTILFPLKKDVEKINQLELAKLKKGGAESLCYKGSDSVFLREAKISRKPEKTDIEKLDKLVSADLDLAVGSQVMLIKNMPDLELVNGSRGVVVKVEADGPTVVFDDGAETKLSKHSFDIADKTQTISRTQFPLILAWALTIHKCQGATLTHVATDLRDAFCNAQVYVTLSRVKTLEGLYLFGINYSKITLNPKVKDYYVGKAEAPP
jgi:ATP-dependent DNA helicase PIF1